MVYAPLRGRVYLYIKDCGVDEKEIVFYKNVIL
jgi:hypothetical protein